MSAAEAAGVTIARLFPDTRLKKAFFAAIVVLVSYLAAGLVNASPVIQPRLGNRGPRTVIVVVPEPQAPGSATPSAPTLDQAHLAL
jgi:hypothetical protein